MNQFDDQLANLRLQPLDLRFTAAVPSVRITPGSFSHPGKHLPLLLRGHIRVNIVTAGKLYHSTVTAKYYMRSVLCLRLPANGKHSCRVALVLKYPEIVV